MIIPKPEWNRNQSFAAFSPSVLALKLIYYMLTKISFWHSQVHIPVSTEKHERKNKENRKQVTVYCQWFIESKLQQK